MENPQKKKLLDLTHKYLDGIATVHEKQVLENYYDLFSSGPNPLEKVNPGDLDKIESRLMTRIGQRISDSQNTTVMRPKNIRLLWRGVAAAIFIGLFTAIFLMYVDQPSEITAMKITREDDVAPGVNKATLTLADGRSVALNTGQAGLIVDHNEIAYSDGSKVLTADQALTDLSDVIVSTPKGAQFQVKLPDGTMVWLNAASSIKFPSSFSRAAERVVLLDGEAYFEVSKMMSPENASKGQVRMPFIVNTVRQKVEVLGTHFNINSYRDEQTVKTTLIEGKVKVTSSMGLTASLNPGEQSIIRAGHIDVDSVDIDQAIAWKSGLFTFDGDDLGQIMRKVARWYNLQVKFDDASLQHKVFSGSFSRFTNVSKVLQKIELTHAARFTIKDGVIIVYKY